VRRRRRKVGAVSTNTLILIGGGLLGLYLISKPKVATPPVLTYPPGYIPASANPTNTAITAGASVLNNLFNNVF